MWTERDQMRNVKLYCGFSARISSDFHALLRSECQRCQSGKGFCLAELMLKVESYSRQKKGTLIARPRS